MVVVVVMSKGGSEIHAPRGEGDWEEWYLQRRSSQLVHEAGLQEGNIF